MTDHERTDEAESVLEDEPDEGEPWAKTSSGDADHIADDED